MILYSNNLNGYVPSEIDNLSELLYLSLGNNGLDSLPDLSMSSMANTIITFDVNNNKLGFADIVPNVGILTNYSPQGLLDDRENREIMLGSSVVLSVSDRYAGNEYVWYKDGLAIENSNSWDYSISSFGLLG